MTDTCNCPHDYHSYVTHPDGTVTVEPHNDWCPASSRYIPRFHWHDRACYTPYTLDTWRDSRLICGKVAGVSLAP